MDYIIQNLEVMSNFVFIIIIKNKKQNLKISNFIKWKD